jgi:hypothetical protein
MALQKITRHTPLAECEGIWQDWLDLDRQLHEQYPGDAPANVKARALQWTVVWYAVEFGWQLTPRAAEYILEQEMAALPTCPYPVDSEAWSTWQALQYAKDIRHHQSIVELSRELTKVTLHGTYPTTSSPPSPQRVRRNPTVAVSRALTNALIFDGHMVG